MKTAAAYKDIALSEIESTKGRMMEVSETIHSYAEVGTKEFKSSQLLCDELRKNGFNVQRGIAELQTAFKASIQGKSGPVVAFLAEYDALPGIGHGCGHNIIGTSAAFAAIALAKLIKELNGEVMVIGTPDEEGEGGKIPMLDRGVFQDVDAVIADHPDHKNAAWWPTVALAEMIVDFEGKQAHYATPQEGANALDAAIAAISTINILRHGFRPDVVFGYTLSTDATTPIIVPDKARVRIAIKATNTSYLKEVSEKVKVCIVGIANSMGVKAKIVDAFSRNLCFEESIPNLTLIETLNRNFKALQVESENPMESSRYRSFFSTDYGNVSRMIPGVNFTIAAAPEDIGLHTPEFAKAAISNEGHDALMTATKVMAMTAIDLLTDPQILRKAKEEFEIYKSSAFADIPLVPLF